MFVHAFMMTRWTSAGRPVLDFKQSEQRELAMRRIIDRMGISTYLDDEDPNKIRLKVNPFVCKDKAWLRAYQRLDLKEPIIKNRPHGQPL